jgi:MOSC domain-containing protein YiiM
MAQIYSIVYQPQNMKYGAHIGDYIRIPLVHARLLESYGIEGDQKGGHNSNRQLNLLSYEWLESVRSLGYRTEPGQFGEQLIVRGLEFASLNPGDRLQLGQEACIEIVKGRTGCERLEAAQGKSIAGIGSIGLLARVVAGGEIRVGDPVSVLTTEQRGLDG